MLFRLAHGDPEDLEELVPLGISGGFSAITGAVRAELLSLDNKASIVPEILPSSLISLTSSQTLFKNENDEYQTVPANCGAKTGARVVENLLHGVVSSNDIDDGNWVGNATVINSTQFTTDGTGQSIKTPSGGLDIPSTGEKFSLRCKVHMSSPAAKFRFVFEEIGASTAAGTYQAIGTSDIEFSQSFTSVGGGTSLSIWCQCDTAGVTVTVTNIQIQNKTNRSDPTVPDDFIDADVAHNLGVAGYRAFSTANGTTVDGNGVVTDALGSALTGMLGEQYEPEATNLFLNSFAPVTQNITTTAQTYTISVDDDATGDITLTGTATGTATAGNPLTVTATAGTLTHTVNGVVNKAQTETGVVATSIIETVGAPITRNARIHKVTWPATLKNNFEYHYTFTHGAYNTAADAFMGGVGTATNQFTTYTDSATGKHAAKVIIASTPYIILSDSALTVGQEYAGKIIYDDGFSMELDGVAQVDTDAVIADMGWGDTEILYVGSDYQGTASTCQVCNIKEAAAKKL